MANRQIFGISNRWHTEINSIRNLACAHMANLQTGYAKQISFETLHLIFLHQQKYLLVQTKSACFLNVSLMWTGRRHVLVFRLQSFMFYTTSSCLHPNKIGPLRKMIYQTLKVKKQTGEISETRKDTPAAVVPLNLPAVRLTTDAVPAVMASTCEWISCLDSSTLF